MYMYIIAYNAFANIFYLQYRRSTNHRKRIRRYK